MSTINENNIIDIDDSQLLANTPMLLVEQNGQTLAIPLKSHGSSIVPSPSGVSLYRCTEYMPGASMWQITSGLVTLSNGVKLSLVGVYEPRGYGTFTCAKTTATESFIGGEVSMHTVHMSGGGVTDSYIEVTYASARIARSVGNLSNRFDAISFEALDGTLLNTTIELRGDTALLEDRFSGYEIKMTQNDGWTESTSITTDLQPHGYTPKPGNIYSVHTRTLISSRYPEVPPEVIKFYKCDSVSGDTWAGYEWIKTSEPSFNVQGATQDACNGRYTLVRDGDYPTSKVYSNGTYYLCTHVGSDLAHLVWTICDNYIKGASDVTRFYQTTSFEGEYTAPHEAVWHGIEVTQTNAGWVLASSLTFDLVIAGSRPVIGATYSEDTTIAVQSVYS